MTETTTLYQKYIKELEAENKKLEDENKRLRSLMLTKLKAFYLTELEIDDKISEIDSEEVKQKLERND